MHTNTIGALSAVALLALAAPAIATAAVGGPGPCGLSYIDSNHPGGPEFNWFSLSGQYQTMLTDEGNEMVQGHAHLCGNPYQHLFVDANGGVELSADFTEDALDPVNECLSAAPSSPEVFLAPYWDDLTAAGPANIWQDTDYNHWFGVQWDGVSPASSNGTLSFELEMDSDTGEILFQYQDVDVGDPALDGGASATVGIRVNGVSLEYSCNEARLRAGLAILFWPCDWIDDDGDGYSECDGDCNDGDATIYPMAPEVCQDGIDQNCDHIGAYWEGTDQDGDGFTQCDGDCDDGAADNFPGNVEICDGRDNDCSGVLDDMDDDGDGWSPCDVPPDCAEGDPLVHPGAAEVCNGIDDDCDPTTVEDADGDGDGFTLCSVPPDCDPAEAAVYPGAPEVCDGLLDNNCDGADDPDEIDADGDGYTVCEGDCDDTDTSIAPLWLWETCNDGIDNDCNGVIDDVDDDQDGYLHPDCGGDDCNDNVALVNPGGQEDCLDNLDNDCSGAPDDLDEDGDGWTVCGNVDCDDTDPAVYPTAPEDCFDGIDNNCDGNVDGDDILCGDDDDTADDDTADDDAADDDTGGDDDGGDDDGGDDDAADDDAGGDDDDAGGGDCACRQASGAPPRAVALVGLLLLAVARRGSRR